jgi:hypothetical protein
MVGEARIIESSINGLFLALRQVDRLADKVGSIDEIEVEQASKLIEALDDMTYIANDLADKLADRIGEEPVFDDDVTYPVEVRSTDQPDFGSVDPKLKACKCGGNCRCVSGF